MRSFDVTLTVLDVDGLDTITLTVPAHDPLDAEATATAIMDFEGKRVLTVDLVECTTQV